MTLLLTETITFTYFNTQHRKRVGEKQQMHDRNCETRQTMIKGLLECINLT